MRERAFVVRPRADQDIVEILCRIAMDDPAAAVSFTRAVRETYELIRGYPNSGRRREFRGRKLKGLRSRPLAKFDSWLVFYRVLPDAVEIARVIHGARDLRRALRD